MASFLALSCLALCFVLASSPNEIEISHKGSVLHNIPGVDSSMVMTAIYEVMNPLPGVSIVFVKRAVTKFPECDITVLVGHCGRGLNEVLVEGSDLFDELQPLVKYVTHHFSSIVMHSISTVSNGICGLQVLINRKSRPVILGTLRTQRKSRPIIPGTLRTQTKSQMCSLLYSSIIGQGDVFAKLPTSAELVSSNGKYSLLTHHDCNLALYDNYKTMWTTKTGGQGYGCVLQIQSNGDLILHTSSGKTLWQIDSASLVVSVFSVQDDGNAVFYRADTKVVEWASKTASLY